MLFCIYMGNLIEYVPSTKEVRSLLGPFLIKPERIRGIYKNTDIDSMVFIYYTTIKTREDFFKALSSTLNIYQWELWDNNSKFYEYRRRRQAGEKGIFYSLSKVRVCYIPETRKVVVAYINELLKNGKCFDDSPAGELAKTKIWPMFFGLCQ